MNRLAHPSGASSLEYLDDVRLGKLAPRPLNIEQTGLSKAFLGDLLCKHLLDRGILTTSDIIRVLALAGPVVEQIVNFLKAEGRIEVRRRAGFEDELRYGLTDRGRASALDAMMRGGYLGPVPVPLPEYARVARAQTVHGQPVTSGEMREAFKDVVLGDDMIDRLGPALNSGRSIFIYGHAGTGKTYIAQRLSRLFYDLTLIPHAISVNETVVELFDPLVHKKVRQSTDGGGVSLDRGHDPRYVCCERPIVISGGELAADMLEVHYDVATRQYSAPLQLKANNGLFIIDDMGRQRITPEELFNRWIVPMEERKDYLSLGAGRHFTVPFDLVLVFSTNLSPLDLADEAFLRRIGYKIEFKPVTPDQYVEIWQGVCEERNLSFDANVVDYTISELHWRHQVPLLPCHPRDLLGMAVDRAAYHGEHSTVTEDDMRWAWNNYFVALDSADSPAETH